MTFDQNSAIMFDLDLRKTGLLIRTNPNLVDKAFTDSADIAVNELFHICLCVPCIRFFLIL